MKITIDYEDGNQRVIEDVMDYATLSKEDLVQAVNEQFDAEGIDKNYEDLSDDIKEKLYSTVMKGCSYYDNLPTMEDFYDEVESAMAGLNLF